MSQCEWNPVLGRPAQVPEAPGDCKGVAVVSVGAAGAFHLCDSCAALPAFKRFRTRTRLRAAQAKETP